MALIENTRRCFKCGKNVPASHFIKTSSKFFQDHYSPICVECLERLVNPLDLNEVDKLCRWLDIPFIPDKWTGVYKQAQGGTLEYYVKLIGTGTPYESLNWDSMNEKWKEAMESGDILDHIDGANQAWLMKMAAKWPAEIERTAEDYHYLENLYNDLLATQNLITATQRDDAKRLAEVGLLINQKIRAGLDASREMTMYHNIIKAEGFEPKNSKSIGDFDSVGELCAWLEKKGWQPKWHVEPQDSVDFTIKQMQQYTKRLVEGEGTIGDQVADRRQQLKLSAALEDSGIAGLDEFKEREILEQIEYEDENDDDKLN